MLDGKKVIGDLSFNTFDDGRQLEQVGGGALLLFFFFFCGGGRSMLVLQSTCCLQLSDSSVYMETLGLAGRSYNICKKICIKIGPLDFLN